MRLSTKQKRLYESHRSAWESGGWDYPNQLSGNKMIKVLDGEYTYKPLWDYCFGSISLESMKIMEIDKSLTKAGSLAIRTRMKELLNKYGIR